MVKKYNEEFYKLNLVDVKPMFSKTIISKLYENNIKTLGDLFELYDDKIKFNSIFVTKGRSYIRSEFIGTTKILRYCYLGEDLELNKQSNIEDFGFSSRATNCILLNSWRFPGRLSIYEKVLKLDSDRHFLASDGIGVLVRDEILTKCKIFRQYNEVKENKEELKPLITFEDNTSFSERISFLLKKLELLEEQEKLLNIQIQSIKSELIELKKDDKDEKRLSR